MKTCKLIIKQNTQKKGGWEKKVQDGRTQVLAKKKKITNGGKAQREHEKSSTQTL
jgi:hypothetical protein